MAGSLISMLACRPASWCRRRARNLRPRMSRNDAPGDAGSRRPGRAARLPGPRLRADAGPAGVITAASAVVSGSIAIVGNVVYWFGNKGAACAPNFPTARSARPAACGGVAWVKAMTSALCASHFCTLPLSTGCFRVSRVPCRAPRAGSVAALCGAAEEGRELFASLFCGAGHAGRSGLDGPLAAAQLRHHVGADPRAAEAQTVVGEQQGLHIGPRRTSLPAVRPVHRLALQRQRFGSGRAAGHAAMQRQRRHPAHGFTEQLLRTLRGSMRCTLRASSSAVRVRGAAARRAGRPDRPTIALSSMRNPSVKLPRRTALPGCSRTAPRGGTER